MNTMKTTNTMRPGLKLALLAPLALIGLSTTPDARADSLLLAQTSLVSGTVATDNSFTAPGAGVVTVSLQNLDWPTQLSALSFSATSASQLLTSWSASGLAVIARRRFAARIFQKRTARKENSASQRSKTRWRNAP